MKIYTSIPSSLPQTALTIGFFDGMHIGHRALLRTLKESGSHCTVLTFVNHPLKILKPDAPRPGLLTPWPLKLALMEQCGIDAAILLPFTLEFASTPYDKLLDSFDLSHLILGQGSAFGKNREGNEKNMVNFAEKKKFSVQYISKSSLGGETISSSTIRSAITSGDLVLAARLLGRDHAFYFPAGQTQFAANEICLPPDGIYSVRERDKKIEITIDTTEKGRRLTLPYPLPTQTLLSFDKEVMHV